MQRYYPIDQSADSAAFRDVAWKSNPRYLDALARAVIVVAPDDCVLAHVHLTRSGSMPRRRASFLAIRRFGDRSVPAIPWMISLAKYGQQDFAKEAFVVLGLLGGTARSALHDLRRLAGGKDRFRATLATAAIKKIEQ